jgi:hypothetical protein
MNTTMTNFSPVYSETDKTDKTDEIIEVSNADFLQAIFGDNLANDCLLLVSFKGNPANVDKSRWYGHPWINAASVELPRDANNYFSLARFKPNDAGEYRRKKAQFQGLYAIMLDDVGSKVPIERLTIEPSWLIETSPGNYQAGYLLSTPITSIKEADQLMSAIINGGLCDPGASGPTTRLARLPVAVNGKHSPPFPCRVKIWFPERRYSIQELIDGFELDLIEKSQPTRKRNHAGDDSTIDHDQVWTPRPLENAVIAALKARNLYKLPLGEAKHDITCPWVNEHTNNTDGGTAYFEPNDNYPLGGFKCLHGHCAQRKIRNLLQYLEVDVRVARMKATIIIQKGEIHRIIDRAECELASSNRYYQRGGMIVSVYTDPGTKETKIEAISPSELVRALSNVATWEQYDARQKTLVRIDPPERHVRVLFDAVSYQHLPIINGLVRQPFLRVDGSVTQTAGYDLESGMFGVFDTRKFLIPDAPSRQEAETALALLNEVLDEFCFSSEADRSAALSAILTAEIRSSLPKAPMIHVRAHSVGSGKSYLCELITAFATPQKGTPTSFPADDEECRKLLLAELLKAPAVIEFDNLTNDIVPHKSLCTALTSEFMSGRILGVSKTVTVSTRALFLSSGNNVVPIKDMTRRCITINLNPEVEIPAARDYKRPNLISEVLQDRERYVSAALTVIRGWIVAGKPRFECKSLAGFGEWSDLCRQPLLWLGCPDPAISIFEAITEEPDREYLGRLLTAWHTAFGQVPTMVRETVNRSMCSGNEDLKEVLHDIAGDRDEINRRSLGRWIKRHAGQIVDGLKFVRGNSGMNAERWRVESVSSVLSVSRTPTEETVNDSDAYRRASEGE